MVIPPRPASVTANGCPDALLPATANGRLGPYPADDFEIATGATVPTRITPSALYYFRHECIAVPRPGIASAGFARHTRTLDDVIAWSRAPRQDDREDRPPLILLGAPLRADLAHLSRDTRTVTLSGTTRPFALAPRLALNRSWFDASSAAFLSRRPLRLRASVDGGTIVGRSFWPTDFRIGEDLPFAPLSPDLPPTLGLREAMREDPCGGAQLPFAGRIIRERAGSAREWKDKPALAVIVNGAQGDDDEAWAGHFAVGTGRIGADGAIADLLVNNFYALDIVSEKGILAAPVPLDGYFGDLNSGQAWYRPSFILIATLRDDTVPRRIQGAFNRVYQQLWRHQLEYRHSTMNCTGISVDVLRALGWSVPSRPSRQALRAWLAIPWTLAREHSISKARMASEYLSEDATRLFPAAAFEEIGADLLRLAASAADSRDGPLATMLAGAVESLLLLRIPQIPSSRTFGTAPVVAADEYRGVVPGNPADMQIVPVPPRPFPPELRDDDLLPSPRKPSDIPLATWIAAVAVVAVAGAWMLIRALLA
ncbi:MAG: hypothetical protein KGL70_14560 [Betaproteobacteria bacterium]|nr:hypothetical protein [Betaproteobacteria bacterium]